MGTRGAVGFRLSNKDYVFYNGYDSYPDSLGKAVLGFVKGKLDAKGLGELIDELQQGVLSLIAIDANSAPTVAQKEWCVALGLANLKVSTGSLDDWYCLIHGTQGNLERALQAKFYDPAEDFLLDSLFCEYAYIVDLGAATLEFYTGFRKLDGTRHTGRYWDAVPDAKLFPFKEKKLDTAGEAYEIENDYGPVSLVLTVSLLDLVAMSTDEAVALMVRG